MSERPEPKLRIAVSACLLGERVRYDGGHRRSRYAAEALGRAFQLVPECPEVGIGLGVPRPKIRLEAAGDGVRLVGAEGEDLTPVMSAYAAAAARRFQQERIAGVVLKSRSPSCGTGDAKVHRNEVVVSTRGDGVFAAVLRGGLHREIGRELWSPPQISETALDDPARRDHWLTRVFGFAALRDLDPANTAMSDLFDFHARWKMVSMAHSETAARRLGRRLAAAEDARSALAAYRRGFAAGLAEPPSIRTHENVLRHLAGHLKRRLDPQERAALHIEITAFRERQVPLAVPAGTLGRHAHRLRVSSLTDQAYLEARPETLRYREDIYRA